MTLSHHTSTGLPASPAAITAIAKNTAKTTTCSTSLRAIASIRLVGNECRIVSISVSGLFCAAAPSAEALPTSFSPTPGLATLTTSSPTASAAVVTISKYSNAFAPMRPTFFMSPVPAMPCTTLAKTSGAIIALIRCRTISRMSTSHWSQVLRASGGSCASAMPSTTPSTSPSMICFVRLKRYQGCGASGAPAGCGVTMF